MQVESARGCRLMLVDAGSCRFVQVHAVYANGCRLMLVDAGSCRFVQVHAVYANGCRFMQCTQTGAG